MLLPDLLLLDTYNGDVKCYLEAVYHEYLQGVAEANHIFLGLPIRCKYTPPTQNKHFGFWHLISTGTSEEDRKIDFRRCERIRWVSFMLQHANNKTFIHCWQNERHGNQHIVLWLKQNDFLVILAKRANYLVLKTAYPIEEKYKTKKLEKEMSKCIDPRNG